MFGQLDVITDTVASKVVVVDFQSTHDLPQNFDITLAVYMTLLRWGISLMVRITGHIRWRG